MIIILKTSGTEQLQQRHPYLFDEERRRSNMFDSAGERGAGEGFYAATDRYEKTSALGRNVSLNASAGR